MGLVRAAASGGCAAACAAPKGLRARLRLERLRRASPRATQILACAAAHPRCSVMRACRTPTQVLEWSRKLASELLLGAMKLPCAADRSTHPATASFALIRRRRAFRVITKTFPWRGSAWTCSTCSRLRRDEPISLRMPFHRYDGPFRWPSPPSLRVIFSWSSGGPHRASEAVASPRWRPFRSRFTFKKRARKRGNLLIADTLRTNVQQCTQHALDTPQNDIFSQLRTIYDCPAVFLANSVRTGGQWRPFQHAFKSLMRSSRLLGI